MNNDIIEKCDYFYKLATEIGSVENWINENVKYPNGGCFFYSAVLSLLFPELKLIKGKHSKQHDDDSYHFYLEDESGNIIDPTKKQYELGKYSFIKRISAKNNIDFIIKDKRFKTLTEQDQSKLLRFSDK